MAVLMTKDEIIGVIRSRVFARKVVTGEGRDSREDLVVDGIENAGHNGAEGKIGDHRRRPRSRVRGNAQRPSRLLGALAGRSGPGVPL